MNQHINTNFYRFKMRKEVGGAKYWKGFEYPNTEYLWAFELVIVPHFNKF